MTAEGEKIERDAEQHFVLLLTKTKHYIILWSSRNGDSAAYISGERRMRLMSAH